MLHLGLGHGKTLRRIINEELDIVPVGLDISLLALLNVRKRTDMKNLICADALNLPFSDNSFSRVFEVGVVEHFYKDDPFKATIVDRELIVESLKEVRRILDDSGKVAFIQPSQHSVLPLSQKIDEMMGKWEFGFQENFSVNDFSQIVSIAGFRNIKYCILQAPDDFPLRIRVGDRLLKTFYTLTGQYRKAELTGALFCLLAEK